MGKFPLEYLGEDTTILNFELCRLRNNLIDERIKYINVIELVASTSSIDEQRIGKCTEAKQSYKPKYHGNNGVHCVKYTDQYTNVTRPITPPQNLLASVTSTPQLITSTSAPTLSAIDRNNQNSPFFHHTNTNLHHPRPTESYYQLFPNTIQVQAEKSVTFALSS